MHRRRLIGTRWIYVGDAHRFLAGKTVVLRSVHRGEEILEDDERIGEIRDDDVLEVAPVIRDAKGGERASFVTSDATLDELRLEGEAPAGRETP